MATSANSNNVSPSLGNENLKPPSSNSEDQSPSVDPVFMWWHALVIVVGFLTVIAVSIMITALVIRSRDRRRVKRWRRDETDEETPTSTTSTIAAAAQRVTKGEKKGQRRRDSKTKKAMMDGVKGKRPSIDSKRPDERKKKSQMAIRNGNEANDSGSITSNKSSMSSSDTHVYCNVNPTMAHVKK